MAHPDLQRVARRAMSFQIMDFSVLETLRTLEKQKVYFVQGRTKTMHSKHLMQHTGYAHAMDLAPYPCDWKKVEEEDPREIARFGVLAGIIRTCAILEGVDIINGMDWDGDGETLDHNFFDAPHFQLLI